MTPKVDVAGVEIPRPDKIMYPTERLTKTDVATYYSEIAAVMLPHLRRRPISMQRFPDGIASDGFFEKRRPDHFPDWVDTVRVQTENGAQDQISVDSPETLVYLVGQGCLVPHTWLSRAQHLGRPDQMIFDLDPSTDDLALLRRAARAIRSVLDELQLYSMLKTSGSRGYHVTVPLQPDQDYDVVRAVARHIAQLVSEQDPDRFTVEMRKDKRGDRVFIDWLRNGYGQTAVPPYALRARPGAPVATPIEWDELSRVEPDHFDHGSVRRRLAQRDDPWQDFERRAQRLDQVVDQLQ
ncbi:non-homologous end-joining DNA ligase [Microlunatus soli]|uniref:Bifunctional non-homologous end joining protein LigD n=1 Tax=Microlunatus soli TaxID=630515 RepID=A0A1H1NA35_9ACTN|nr:non-homologous end-joining DNA ligase [Microlunatus soli]SDR95836.1 bifunctional non-homologous end joining protein LigD [Microlunatus soli]